MKKTLLCAALTVLCYTVSTARISFPGIIGDNMVLQRNTEVSLWGWTDGKSVTVSPSWTKDRYKVKPDDKGRWSVKVKTGEAGGPYSIIFNDGEEIMLKNVMHGEVWICCGQSNMEMPVCGFMHQGVEHSVEAIVSAGRYKSMRLFNVPRVHDKEPQENVGGNWQVCSPASAASFSATAFFFGRTIQDVLGQEIPLGLVAPNWGGSTIETWMTTECIDAIEGIDHEKAKSGRYEHTAPQRLFNSMIFPIKNFNARGFIWYQGESNRFNWFDYRKLLVALVKLWRNLWGNPDMPFYYVQLAPFTYEGDNYRSLPLVVEAQYKAMEDLQHVGIAATTDIGNRQCIHPAQKHQVGERLAWLALANDYGIEGLPRPAPTFKEMELVEDERRGKMLVLSFNNLSSRHSWNDPDSFLGYGKEGGYCSPDGFEIAGADKVWHKARGNYKWWENRIEVWSDQVPDPIAVRYAFKNYCEEANVVTTMGQPLAPFRTDDWELDDIGEIR